MSIKPLTIACESDAKAIWLATEYAYIGRKTTRIGRFLTVLTS